MLSRLHRSSIKEVSRRRTIAAGTKWITSIEHANGQQGDGDGLEERSGRRIVKVIY